METAPRSHLRQFASARFGRVTSSGRVVPPMDGLRFVAILAVVLFRIQFIYAAGGSPGFGDPARQGALGQALLFVAFERPFMRPDWPSRLRSWLAGSSGAARKQ